MAGKRRWMVLRQLDIKVDGEVKKGYVEETPPVPIKNAQHAAVVLKKMTPAYYVVNQVSLSGRVGPTSEPRQTFEKDKEEPDERT